MFHIYLSSNYQRSSYTLYILCKAVPFNKTRTNMAPSYKLSYFDFPGRAEPTRLIFAYGGIKYTDERFSHEDWPKYKPNTPFGEVPVLSVDGEVIAQSKAITRYAGRIVKLAGNNELEDLKIDSIVDYIYDLEEKVARYFWEVKDEKKKEEVYKKLINEQVPAILKNLEAIAKANGGHLAVNRLTWADLYFVNVVESTVNGLNKDVFADYPNLVAVKKNVLALPTIKEYLKNRKPCLLI